jgi:hypothetical protein
MQVEVTGTRPRALNLPRVNYFTRVPAPSCHESFALGGGVGHDTASDPGQLALTGRELVVLRLARPPRVLLGLLMLAGIVVAAAITTSWHD